MHSSIKKEVKHLGMGDVSKTLRSTMFPHSYNLTPSQDTRVPNSMVLRKLGDSMHNKFQETAATGQYQNYLNKGNGWLKEEDANRTRPQQMNKYEINQTIKGQAVGGPVKKPQITMWDMLTLYDTQKKRIED